MTPTSPLTAREFRYAMSRLAKGVAVVTATHEGQDHAMTADSLTSVSLDPLLVLVCVDRDTRFRQAILDTGRWGASVLGADAERAGWWFATKGRPLEGQFDDFAHHRTPGGQIVLEGSVVTLEAVTTQVVEAGDHTIVIGEVVHLEVPSADTPALVFYHGRFTVPVDNEPRTPR